MSDSSSSSWSSSVRLPDSTWTTISAGKGKIETKYQTQLMFTALWGTWRTYWLCYDHLEAFSSSSYSQASSHATQLLSLWLVSCISSPTSYRICVCMPGSRVLLSGSPQAEAAGQSELCLHSMSTSVHLELCSLQNLAGTGLADLGLCHCSQYQSHSSLWKLVTVTRAVAKIEVLYTTTIIGNKFYCDLVLISTCIHGRAIATTSAQ